MFRSALLQGRSSLLRGLQRPMSSFVAVPFFQVDSFSLQPYGGNPAAVVLLPATLPPLTDGAMAKIAAENNLSETCFVVPVSVAPAAGFGAGAEFNLRWFTPTKEVRVSALCALDPCS
jgi:PhzF family phenazine biosynthesis protein